MNQNDFQNRAKSIRIVLSDVDGVLTDGGMYYSESGDEFKRFSVRDGVGVKLMQAAGFRVGFLTGESVQLVSRRAEKLKCDWVFRGVVDKLETLQTLADQEGFDLSEVAYVGDEINDYCLLGNVGLFFAVNDAAQDIQDKADYILDTRGGEGALREMAYRLLRAQGQWKHTWDTIVSSYQDKA